jgi:hypothetical protein
MKVERNGGWAGSQWNVVVYNIANQKISMYFLIVIKANAAMPQSQFS